MPPVLFTAYRPISPLQSALCDLLRFVSATAVACHHILGRLGFEGYIELAKNGNTNPGYAGISALFALSGFLIFHTLLGRLQKNGSYCFTEFFFERLCRIYVVFLPAMMLAPLIGLIWMPHILSTELGSLERWLTNFFMLCDIWPSAKPQAIYFLMIPSWTLNYDVFFYAIIGLGVLPLTRQREGRLATLALLFLCVLLISQAKFFWLFFANWGAGAFFAFLHHRGSGIRPTVALVLGLVVIVIFYFTQPHFYGAIPYLLTATVTALFGLIFLSRLSPVKLPRLTKYSRFFASYSYCLYLTHSITLSFIADFYPAFLESLFDWFGKTGAFLISLLVINLTAIAFAWATEWRTTRVRDFVLSRKTVQAVITK